MSSQPASYSTTTSKAVMGQVSKERLAALQVKGCVQFIGYKRKEDPTWERIGKKFRERDRERERERD